MLLLDAWMLFVVLKPITSVSWLNLKKVQTFRSPNTIPMLIVRERNIKRPYSKLWLLLDVLFFRIRWALLDIFLFLSLFPFSFFGRLEGPISDRKPQICLLITCWGFLPADGPLVYQKIVAQKVIESPNKELKARPSAAWLNKWQDSGLTWLSGLSSGQ